MSEGLLRRLGRFTGQVTGGFVGGGLEVVGEVVGSNLIKEIGQGVYHATVNSTEMVGRLADSAVITGHGIATRDGEKIKQGLGEAGHVVKTTAIGVRETVIHTAHNTSQMVNGVLNNDLEAAGHSARELAKTVAISALAIGMCDLVIDGVDAPAVAAAEMVGDTVVGTSEVVGNIAGSSMETVGDTVVAARETMTNIVNNEVVVGIAGGIAGKVIAEIIGERIDNRVAAVVPGEIVEHMTVALFR